MNTDILYIIIDEYKVKLNKHQLQLKKISTLLSYWHGTTFLIYRIRYDAKVTMVVLITIVFLNLSFDVSYMLQSDPSRFTHFSSFLAENYSNLHKVQFLITKEE